MAVHCGRGSDGVSRRYTSDLATIGEADCLVIAALRCKETARCFFYPWYPALMLVVESSNVIEIRLRKIATGEVNVTNETRLMVREKIDAAVDAGSMLVSGKHSADVIDFTASTLPPTLVGSPSCSCSVTFRYPGR
jgi:hypothetical protein